MVWIQSAIGASLFLGFFGILTLPHHEILFPGLYLCGIIWLLGYAPVRSRAEELAPEERPPARGLPSWILSVWLVGEFIGGMIPGPREWTKIVLLAHVWAGTALFLRGWVMLGLDLPIHRPTWTKSLGILAAGLLWKLTHGLFAWS